MSYGVFVDLTSSAQKFRFKLNRDHRKMIKLKYDGASWSIMIIYDVSARRRCCAEAQARGFPLLNETAPPADHASRGNPPPRPICDTKRGNATQRIATQRNATRGHKRRQKATLRPSKMCFSLKRRANFHIFSFFGAGHLKCSKKLQNVSPRAPAWPKKVTRIPELFDTFRSL